MEEAQDTAKDARKLEVNGWVCAAAALFIPVAGIAGVVLGAILAGKPGKASRGAAIVVVSVLLAAGSGVFWYEHVLHQDASQATPAEEASPDHPVTVEASPDPEAQQQVEEEHSQCAPHCVGENEPTG